MASAQPAAPGGIQGTPPATGRAPDYVVGPQDVLKVTVFDEPTMSGTYRVDSDGSFQYPMLGRIQAAA